MPAAQTRGVLVAYLAAVAAALTFAWAPSVASASLTGEIAGAVGPYTSMVTQALDLGLVVPLAVVAAVGLRRAQPAGFALTVVLLVVNVCTGAVLAGQLAAQLSAGVPLTTGEIVGKSLTFLVLTVVAGGLLARVAVSARAERRPS